MRLLDWLPVYGNCRHYSVYLDEDLIGKMKTHACESETLLPVYWFLLHARRQQCLYLDHLRRVVGHTHPRTMGVAALNHYCILASLRWVGRKALDLK